MDQISEYHILSILNQFSLKTLFLWRVKGYVTAKEFYVQKLVTTPPKTNMDTQNDGLERVTSFKNGNFGYLCYISGV